MKIEYSKGKLVSLLLENKEKIFSITILILALLIAAAIYRSQSRHLYLLTIKKDTEIKKNAVLGKIKESEKKIKFYKGLLKEKDASSIVNAINNIAKDSGVQIISIEPQAEEKQSLYVNYPFILTINADNYHAIGKFISKIESYSNVYFTQAISIRPLGDLSNEESEGTAPKINKLTVNLTLNIIAFRG